LKQIDIHIDIDTLHHHFFSLKNNREKKAHSCSFVGRGKRERNGWNKEQR